MKPARFVLFSVVIAILTSTFASAPADAQQSSDILLRYVQPLILAGGLPVDGIRLEQLRTGARIDGFLIRSPSSLTPRLPGDHFFKVALIAPEYYSANNTAIPFSINDGPVWAGRGTSQRTLAGFRLEAGPLTISRHPSSSISRTSSSSLATRSDSTLRRFRRNDRAGDSSFHGTSRRSPLICRYAWVPNRSIEPTRGNQPRC